MPVSRQASKSLLMKAMQQAEQSVAKARRHLSTTLLLSLSVYLPPHLSCSMPATVGMLSALLQAVGITVGLAESNGSLPLGL